MCAQDRPPSATSAVTASLIASAVVYCASSALSNQVFGILDNTADELADLIGVDEVSPAAARLVLALRPVYEPVKAASLSCTDGVFPEFNEVNDLNDCLLLPSRLVWRGSGPGPQPPFVIRQTMSMSTIWKQSTGSAIWGGGLVLSRQMEALGHDFWAGKRVLELGTGTGLGALTAAKLGALDVLATDRDQQVLQLADVNARGNLGERNAVRTKLFEWGGDAAQELGSSRWDVVIGADLTYNRDAWPVLFETVRSVGAPTLLSASERRPNELAELRRYLDDQALPYRVVDSPFTTGYASSNVKLFWITPRRAQS
uniref:Calmodulin-lysine N-methyltransferase n=1 Tax=Coccolithus braarudii TaxID=221442 RepID=A0A7S0Q9S9_9EUKA